MTALGMRRQRLQVLFPYPVNLPLHVCALGVKAHSLTEALLGLQKCEAGKEDRGGLDKQQRPSLTSLEPTLSNIDIGSACKADQWL